MVERHQDQDQEAAEVARLLDELLALQRRRRAQEKLLAEMLRMPFRKHQTLARIDPSPVEDIAGNVWGGAGNSAMDSPITLSSRPLSFSTSTTVVNATPPCDEDIGTSLNDSHGGVATRSYDAAPDLLLYMASIAPHSASSLPKISARGVLPFEIAPKKPTGMVSWGNRVGRRIRGCRRQIMGKA